MLLFVSQLGVWADHTKVFHHSTSTICMNFSSFCIQNQTMNDQTNATKREKVANLRIMGASYEK